MANLAFEMTEEDRNPLPELDYRGLAYRLSRSDERAFGLLVRNLHGPLFRYACSLGLEDAAADDVVQVAFVRVWNGRASLDRERSLRTLLFVAVRNLCSNARRDRRRRADAIQTQTQSPGMGSAGPRADLGVEADDLANRIRGWISELPERQAEALRLSRFEQLSHAEVAEVMSVSPRTVNNHLVRALRHLRARLEEHDPELLSNV